MGWGIEVYAVADIVGFPGSKALGAEIESRMFEADLGPAEVHMSLGLETRVFLAKDIDLKERSLVVRQDAQRPPEALKQCPWPQNPY